MVKNRTLYLIFSCLSMVMLGFSFYFLIVHLPVYAWICSVCAVCSTKGRIAVGGRVGRTALFYLHLAFSIPGFLFLTYLAFIATPLWLFTLTTLLYALTFITGIPSWLEGVKKALQPS